jgi:hypothetical protein
MSIVETLLIAFMGPGCLERTHNLQKFDASEAGDDFPRAIGLLCRESH